MGVSGTLDYLSDLVNSRSKGKKRKQLQTVDLKIKMDCDGCVLKVKNTLKSLRGVENVDVSRKDSKVSVRGYVEPKKVLKAAKATGKKVEIWPYVPYHLVPQPYSSQCYDKKAPSGFVRKVENHSINNSVSIYQDDPYTAMFSDDNANGCSII